jgi:arylsulfatase B
MHSQGTLTKYKTGDNALSYYLAAIKAMDYQIGRLLSTMSQAEKDNTIILLG